MTNKKNKNKIQLPFVSICTPTFNRRPFIPMMLKCFEHQTYPKDKIEWIIIDDGTDKIEELVSHIPQVKYIKCEEKLTLGKKRNMLNSASKGDIIIYMDDDDYYPPERISHAVETLQQNPKALCAGSSIMHIYFKHINKMVQFGPYGPNHATAATFAFRKELLLKTKFEEHACIAEEKQFLKDYTIPFVQLDSMKTILVFSHVHNSFDKKELLKVFPTPFANYSNKTPEDFVKNENILNFFMKDIDNILDLYDLGNPKHKPDVIKQMQEIKLQRENIQKKQIEHQEILNKINNQNNQVSQNNQINDQHQHHIQIIQNLIMENNQLKEKLKYLEDKIKQLISEKIEEKKNNK
jgi:glycosyltransferase involved in cell wall biosynthesis